MNTPAVDAALAAAHEASFGRLVGWLFRMTGDLQLAEDAVAGAFLAAVPAWRTKGVPTTPEAWLRVAARNNARTALTRATRTVVVDPEELTDVEATVTPEPELDDRLSLMLVCAHPAIDARLHAPLMLQSVLGVDAARIAAVYLVPPATMGQRLSRAKVKIRDAGIRFRRPEPDEWPARLEPVLQAVYAAYGAGDVLWDAGTPRLSELREESLRLAELLTETMPDDPEAWGLLALLLHTESRRPARVVGGRFVPLAEQDTTLWSVPLRRQADDCLRRAYGLGRVGRFQWEAAISAIHSARGDGIPVDHDAVVTLYRGLLRDSPSLGATIGAAGAMMQAGLVDQAESLLDAIPEVAVRRHQPYWVCRAELLGRRGRSDDRRQALDIAIGLTGDPAVREYLVQERLR
jgi:RNA polymerase sigma-70 factor (ECF subfamily)